MSGAPTGYRYPDARLLIIAKAPLPGQVKTRLIPALSAARAARLHARLLQATVANMLLARLCPITLCCAPDTLHPDFQYLAGLGAHLTRQIEGDLGERMGDALAKSLQFARYTIVIGTDCPLLDAGLIEHSIVALAGDFDAVLGPAEDGGYYLLGISRFDPRLFGDIAWGTSEVLQQTRERLKALQYRWLELQTLWDVDRPEDLGRLRATLGYD